MTKDNEDALPAVVQVPQGWKLVPVERGDVVAFEFYNRATGHAIVDYSVNTHVGNLSADKGYEARPLVYADKREEVTDGSKPIPLWQAREALDELESAARGDEPFNHFAAGLVRSALEQAAAPEAPAQGEQAAEPVRDERAAFEAWVAKVQPAYWRAEAWQTEAWAMWQSISAALGSKERQPSVPAPWREAVKVAREELAWSKTSLRNNRLIDAALAQLDALEGGE